MESFGLKWRYTLPVDHMSFKIIIFDLIRLKRYRHEMKVNYIKTSCFDIDDKFVLDCLIECNSLILITRIYSQTSDIRHTLVGNKIVDQSACRRCSNYIIVLDLTSGINELDKEKTTARRGNEHLSFWIRYGLY